MTIELTQDQIDTIVWIMEGYCQGNDDYYNDPEFAKDVDKIFEILIP